jgi:hypothetical protein
MNKHFERPLLSMFYDTNYTRATEMELYTDASLTVGYGGYSKGKWFCSPWPEDLPTSTKNKLSMAFFLADSTLCHKSDTVDFNVTLLWRLAGTCKGLCLP